MRRFYWVTAAVMVVAVAWLCARDVQGEVSAQGKVVPMAQKWEYLVESVLADTTAMNTSLNKAGTDGWEFSAAYPERSAGGMNMVIYKRAKR